MVGRYLMVRWRHAMVAFNTDLALASVVLGLTP